MFSWTPNIFRCFINGVHSGDLFKDTSVHTRLGKISFAGTFVHLTDAFLQKISQLKYFLAPYTLRSNTWLFWLQKPHLNETHMRNELLPNSQICSSHIFCMLHSLSVVWWNESSTAEQKPLHSLCPAHQRSSSLFLKIRHWNCPALSAALDKRVKREGLQSRSAPMWHRSSAQMTLIPNHRNSGLQTCPSSSWQIHRCHETLMQPFPVTTAERMVGTHPNVLCVTTFCFGLMKAFLTLLMWSCWKCCLCFSRNCWCCCWTTSCWRAWELCGRGADCVRPSGLCCRSFCRDCSGAAATPATNTHRMNIYKQPTSPHGHHFIMINCFPKPACMGAPCKHHRANMSGQDTHAGLCPLHFPIPIISAPMFPWKGKWAQHTVFHRSDRNEETLTGQRSQVENHKNCLVYVRHQSWQIIGVTNCFA